MQIFLVEYSDLHKKMSYKYTPEYQNNYKQGVIHISIYNNLSESQKRQLDEDYNSLLVSDEYHSLDDIKQKELERLRVMYKRYPVEGLEHEVLLIEERIRDGYIKSVNSYFTHQDEIDLIKAELVSRV